jgi:hypothetical protein
MRQREVQDADNVRWSCVQALGALDPDRAEAAAEKLADASGDIPVVCTPSGGAQSVRIMLPPSWMDDTDDETLLAAIAAARAAIASS